MSTELENVVIFPNSRVISPPQSLEEMLNDIRDIRLERVDIAMEDVMVSITALLYNEGFDVLTDENARDVALLYETVRSLMLKCMHVEHPLQETADSIFEYITKLDDIVLVGTENME